MLLDRVTDPHNAGAVLRSAEVFGARAVIAPKHHSAPETGALAKTASGALERQPYLRVTNLADAMQELRDAGYLLIGLEGEAALSLSEAVAQLSAMRIKLEQHFQDNRTYVGACAAGTIAPLPTGLKYCTVTCPTLTATAHTIQAAGGITGEQSMAGFTYTINEANTRNTTAVPDSSWGTATNTCWVTKKGGLC